MKKQMEFQSNRLRISYSPYSRLAGERDIAKLASSYTQQLEEWLKGASAHNRDCYLAVVNTLLLIEVNDRDHHWNNIDVLIDCQGLDSLPPLPTQFKTNISLTLKGQPTISFQTFLADLPRHGVKSLTICDNDTITVLSSETIFVDWLPSLHIQNCPNFTHFVGVFNVNWLKLSNITVPSLLLSPDNFPFLSTLHLNDNSNLTSIQVKENFPLQILRIFGDHNKLTTFPPFCKIESININPLGLASISDYTWFYDNRRALRCCLVSDAVVLLESHYKEGKVVDTVTLIEMAKSILTSRELDGPFVFTSHATRCLKILLGESAAASFVPPELILGKLFLDGKLVERDEKIADNFFRLALNRERDIKRNELLKKIIEFLPHWDYYQKVHLFSSEEAANLPSELRQFIFSLGSKEMTGTGFALRQQKQEEKKRRKLNEYWY